MTNREQRSKRDLHNVKLNGPIDPTDPLYPLDFPELVFGLVGPIGTDLPLVISSLRNELENFDYAVEEIKLSGLIESFLGKKYSCLAEDKRIENLMRDGTYLREKSERGDVVALLGIAEIRRLRTLSHNEKNSQKIAYILISLKHPHEIETLKNVYGSGFFSISAYSPRETRVNALAKRISKSTHQQVNNCRSSAESLIEKDESETGKTLGQNIKDAFPLSDLFVDCKSRLSLKSNIKRFIELLFSHPFHTPSKDEYGMFHAKSAAVRSSDLGRQVGAVIATKESDIIAIGCNDVPKAGGGLYWPEDKDDSRDFHLGIDPMSEHREQIISQILEKFKEFINLEINSSNHENKNEELVNNLLSVNKSVLKGTQITNLLEFGRSVHAEMVALMDAARRGVSVKGATLYSTTFPCHLCTGHIVAAGIDRVVYIEPYPKSRAKHLYGDSICVDSPHVIASKVNFEPFTGVAPRQYLQIFEIQGERKDLNGQVIDFEKRENKPRIVRFRNTHLEIETVIVAKVIKRIKELIKLNPQMEGSNE